MKIARLAARTIIGGLFIGHGTQKLLGWFGGPGMTGTEGMMHGLGMHPPRHHAYAAGVAETAGGALLALGLATPLAASALTGTMITAIRKVHWRNGVWNMGGGYEYNAVLIASVLALAESGPGHVSLDHLLGWERSGTRWALAALAGGAVASAAAVEYGHRNATAEVIDAREPAEQQAGADRQG